MSSEEKTADSSNSATSSEEAASQPPSSSDTASSENRSVMSQALRNIRRNSHLLLAELTIGFPFIGYKFLASLLLESLGTSGGKVASAFLLVLAVVDMAFNLVNLTALIFVGHRMGAVCFLSWLFKHTPLRNRFNDLGEALDTMLSFTIVAVVVGANLFSNLIAISQAKAGSLVFFYMWNVCTVANVLGAGIARLQSSFHHTKVMDRMDKKS